VGSVTGYIEALDSRLSQINAVSPKVSIIVTNFNYADYIQDCLHSVSLQTYPDVECIVVDDHSSDDSLDRIERFIRSDKSHVGFTLIRHESNRGQHAAFRSGVQQAAGAFVSFLDADDLLLSDFVSEHVRVHLRCPPVAFTSSNQYQIDSKGQVIGAVHPDLETQNTYRSVGTISLRRSFWVWATTSSMMFRRPLLNYVLSDSDDAFRKCADNYICHFSNLLGGSILIPNVLGCYRRHQNNTFSNNPLIGGRLPTGDMRNHPGHRLVLHHINKRLFECSQQFISLLGVGGFFDALAKVTPLTRFWHNGRAICRKTPIRLGQSLPFYAVFARLGVRTLVRTLKRRHPSYTVRDLDGVKRAANVASYTDYQRHRRDAK
jgi:glycosyltransferase involved in cell wall biosynthesis